MQKTQAMKKVLLLILLPLFCASVVAEPVLDSLKIQGQMRHFWIYKPAGIQKGAPLVFVLHGYGNPGQQRTWMNEAAEKHKFAICIPCGWKDPQGKPSWNVGYPFQQGWKVDEVAGMEQLAKHVQKKYGLSRKNTFMTGMSNGGEMCYLTAYSKQKTFNEIHGTADHTSEWNGDLENKGGWGAYMSVPIAIGYWIAKNKCEHETVEHVEGLNKENGCSIIKHKYTGGPTGCEVWLYEVINGPHSWFDRDINTGEEIWSFFSKYLE